MKKKLFLLITCFFLFSSLAIFLTYRNIQLSETIKNREEEAKKSLKELEDQKEKNSANQENKDNQEEIDDLPWLLNWKGAIIDLIISTVVIHIAINCSQNLKGKMEEKENGKMYTILCLIIILLCIVVFPPIFAIKKYKNKSYWERLKLIEKNFLVFVIFGIIFAIMMISLIAYENMKENKNKYGNPIFNNTASLIAYETMMKEKENKYSIKDNNNNNNIFTYKKKKK